MWKPLALNNPPKVDCVLWTATGLLIIAPEDWDRWAKEYLENGPYDLDQLVWTPAPDPPGKQTVDTDCNTELLDSLLTVLHQACHSEEKDGKLRLDSGAISAYADGLLTLAKYGRARIVSEFFGRRVIVEVCGERKTD